MFLFFLFLFIQKHIYNGHINKMKKTKTKICIIVMKATTTPEIKLKEEQLQN